MLSLRPSKQKLEVLNRIYLNKKCIGSKLLKCQLDQSIKRLNSLKVQRIWDADLGSQCPNLRKKAFKSIVKNFIQGNSDLDSLN